MPKVDGTIVFEVLACAGDGLVKWRTKLVSCLLLEYAGELKANIFASSCNMQKEEKAHLYVIVI